MKEQQFDISQMLDAISTEMGRNEDLISSLSNKNEQLEVIRQNLKQLANGTAPEVVSVEPLESRPRPKHLSAAGRKAIQIAQRKRHERERFNKLAQTPLPKARATKLHWTQLPENKRRVNKWARAMRNGRIASGRQAA